MVTSRAVVGSSMMSSDGSVISAMAITQRCSMPPESWCGYRFITASGSGIATLVSISVTRANAAPRSMPRCWRATSASCLPMTIDGFSALRGLW